MLLDFETTPPAPGSRPWEPKGASPYMNNEDWADALHASLTWIWCHLVTADSPQVVKLGPNGVPPLNLPDGSATYLSGRVALAMTVLRDGSIALGPAATVVRTAPRGREARYLWALMESLRALQRHPLLHFSRAAAADGEITMNIEFECKRAPSAP